MNFEWTENMVERLTLAAPRRPQNRFSESALAKITIFTFSLIISLSTLGISTP
jgi:hypothetical protein